MINQTMINVNKINESNYAPGWYSNKPILVPSPLYVLKTARAIDTLTEENGVNSPTTHQQQLQLCRDCSCLIITGFNTVE